MDLPDSLVEKLQKTLEPNVIELPKGIQEYANKFFKNELSYLYYPDLHILPLTPKGEEQRKYLYNECDIARYGAYEFNFHYNFETYLAILVNND